MFILYLVKTNDASEGTMQRWLLPVRLVIEPEFCNFFKSLFKPLTFQHLSENSQINFLLPKTLNSYKFSIKMRTSAAPDCCTIWSGLHRCVINEAIDHVAWTAARLCENWWTRLQTLARIIWTLLDSYLMWQFNLCADLVFDAVGLWYAVKIVARFYTVQYEHVKWDMVACAFVFVPIFLEYVSAKPPTPTQPGHPLLVGAVSTSESWGINRHTARCTSPVSMVWQCKLVSGWGLRKQKSAPRCGPCALRYVVRGVHNRSIRLRLSSFWSFIYTWLHCLWGDFYENFWNFEHQKNVLAGGLGPPNLVGG